MCYFPFIRNKEKGKYFISYFNNSRYHVKFFLFLEQIKIGAELFLHKSGIMGTFSIIKCSTIHSGSPSKCWKSCKMSPMHLYWGIKGINLLCTLHLVTFISSKPKICEMEVNCQYTNRYTTYHLISASILNLNLNFSWVWHENIFEYDPTPATQTNSTVASRSVRSDLEKVVKCPQAKNSKI